MVVVFDCGCLCLVAVVFDCGCLCLVVVFVLVPVAQLVRALLL